MRNRPTLSIILASLFVLLSVSAVSAFDFGTDYTETVVDNGVGASGYDYISTVDFLGYNGLVGWGMTESWQHSLNPSYMPVPDQYVVTSASLTISGHQFFGFGADMVEFAGTMHWTQPTGWSWVSHTDNTFDLTSIDYSYWNSDPFEVSITPIFDVAFLMDQSTLSVDYAFANTLAGGGTDASAVPEPTSMLLLGLGLAGVAGYRRIRRG